MARRVIELYRPQTIPYRAAAHGEPWALWQAPQNDIPAKLAAWRAARHRVEDRFIHDFSWREESSDPVAAALRPGPVRSPRNLPMAGRWRTG